ncbi:MFS transporter [Phenylobacterium soli]|nr:MFS transporter [Phenylobacterium soli]
MSQGLEAIAPAAEDSPDDMVAEVAGAPFTPLETAAAISLGVLALVGAGVLGMLLAALADEHRLTAAGIGRTAMLEALSMGLATGLAGILLKPRRLRLVGVVASLLLVLVNLATFRASGDQVLIIRLLAGVPEGVLLWIAVGLISRTATPERWAGFMFTGMGLTQLAAAMTLTAYVLPHFGANGGYALLAATGVLCALVALVGPSEYGAVPGTEQESSGAPPLKGWIALLATLGFSGSIAAVGVYLIPLAHEAGLANGAGRTAASAGVGAQILGGILATALAGRVRYIWVFAGCAAALALAWITFAVSAPAWWFILVTGLAGMAGGTIGPFLVPMTIEADPTRRAAVQSGATQVLAGALGPFLASLAVREGHAHGVLVLGAVLLALGLAVAAALHATTHPEPAAAA